MHITLKVVIIPSGVFGKLAEVSAGKDTTIGHWEMAGIYSPDPFPVYPDGFQTVLLMNSLKRQEFQEYFAISRLQEHR